MLSKIWRLIIGEYNYQKNKDRKFKKWFLKQGVLSRDTLKTECKRFEFQPRISILVPVYNTPVKYLDEMVKSVQDQVYENWELCLADDCSGVSDTLQYLKSLPQDPRIKIFFRPQNGHISETSNTALEMATGEYCALLDHDDRLSEDALFWVVKALNENRVADFLYSDECKIEDNGNLSEPTFKPLWSPDSLLSRNYPGHLAVCNTALMRSMGGFSKGLEGSQDFDLYLRITEKARRIVHIPRILYYWRKHPQSVSANAGSKPYAYEAAERALTMATERRREFGELIAHDHDMLGYYTLRYPLKAFRKINIILFADQSDGKLKDCLHSLLPHTNHPSFTVTLITEAEKESFTHHPLVQICSMPFGTWAEKVNAVVQSNEADYFVLLDASVRIIQSDWLMLLAEQLQRPSVGVVGPKMIYPDNTLFQAGMYPNDSLLPANLFEGVLFSQHHKLANSINNYPFFSHTCMGFSKEAFVSVSGFNTEYSSVLASYDFCLKLLETNRVHVYIPHAAVRFLKNKPTPVRNQKDESEFLARWKPQLSVYRQHSLFLSTEFAH